MKQVTDFIQVKRYYIFMLLIIAFMITGVIINNPYFAQYDLGRVIHIILVVLLTICILLYPKYETFIFRTVIIIFVMAYTYTLFLLYPETWSTFVLVCFSPAISILLFDSKLFHFSIVLNVLFMTIFYCYIFLYDTGSYFAYVRFDIIGNIINFFGSQVILYLIFYFSFLRIKRLQIYYEQIQQAERLRLTGELAAAVAHEIRNPLTVVKGFLQLYEQDNDTKHEVRDKFTLMIEELNAAEHVISNFLTIAKPDKDKKIEAINVKEAIQSVTDLVKSYGCLHANRIEFNVLDNCYIAINFVEFKQLFINIIKNAIEASSKGNTVFIHAEKKLDCIVIKVEDTGCGMTNEEISLLGTPFYSLKSKGTGLGMMICFNTVEKYDGKIEITSTKGKGTIVTVSFPSCEWKGV
ncbi:HAMP domain-containing histidine kinase [Bacillus sp. Bva_UNVM-123]|uniref:ATP-binding protein n=1 Tax=Bacillus sp. Bva_UNVM-123 TaxID=2829798 RepID=UPI00391F08C5